MSNILDTFNLANKIQKELKNSVAKIDYANYKGYYVNIQDIELEVIKASLNALAQKDRSFSQNVRLKYGR